jgi:hypothetical protein
MPATRSRNTTRTTKLKPVSNLASAATSQVAATASHTPTVGQGAEEEPAHHAADKRNISEAITDAKDTTPTKKLKLPHKGRNTSHQQRKLYASPITPPKGRRKRTNECLGLIGKAGRRTKEEVAAQKAEKEAKAEAAAVAKADAVARLAEMEMDQEHAVVVQCQRVLRRQPSVLDVTKLEETSSEESNGKLSDNNGDTEIENTDSEEDGNTTPNAKEVKGPMAVSNRKKTKVSMKHWLFETVRRTL